MKKIIAVSALLVLAVACSAPPTNRSAEVSANKPSETKAAQTVSLAEMEAREKATWEALQKKDYDAFANLLTSEYLEVESGGLFDKPGIIASVKDISISDVSFANWKLLPIDNDAVVLLYDLTVKWTYKGQAVPPGPYRASSAWVNREGKWLAIYYQQTAVKAAPAAAAPSASQPAKAAVSPTQKLADAGSDPIANEKLVWEAFKSRDYDAFAALLAPEFLEVEADGVYDKAGSVKAAAMFDATKAELSEWKSVRFDADASLVTYVVKIPGAPAERHSTIWMNRGGKWLGLLHQGTAQEATVSK
jgi:hypothetical protein